MVKSHRYQWNCKRKKLYIDDFSALPPTEVRARARRIAKMHDGKLGCIMVDYLQLMKVPGMGDNRVGEISEISRSLKALAKRKCNVPGECTIASSTDPWRTVQTNVP